MNKEQIKERIEEIDAEIQALTDEKQDLTNELINNSDSLRDKINAILSSDNESTWIMSYTNGGLLDDELTGDRYNRR